MLIQNSYSTQKQHYLYTFRICGLKCMSLVDNARNDVISSAMWAHDSWELNSSLMQVLAFFASFTSIAYWICAMLYILGFDLWAIVATFLFFIFNHFFCYSKKLDRDPFSSKRYHTFHPFIPFFIHLHHFFGMKVGNLKSKI